jgi:choline dehydrogenase-like flavoprotein
LFVDARDLTPDQTLTAGVCVVGGGVAGITLAVQLARAEVDVCLVESGGLHSDDATDDLFAGENVGIPYAFDTHTRSRYLGGSSNCWGGWNRPLEPEDFAPRAWVPHSGWPLTYDEMQPWYARTHELLTLGPQTFDADFWGDALEGPRLRRVPFERDGPVRDSFSQFSRQHRLRERYQHELESSPHVRVLLHANVTNIATDEQAGRVTHVDVRTLGGRRTTVRARHFVLAAGGIENARVLLASDRVRPAGLGNDHDLVGRYFMDHPRLQVGRVHLRGPWRRTLLYDIKHQDRSDVVAAHGTSVAAAFVLDPAVVEREELLNARVWLSSVFPGEDSPGVESLRRLRKRLTEHKPVALGRGSDLAGVVRHPASVLGYTAGRALPRGPLVRGVRFEAIVEPQPNPDSRVTLTDERDAVGMRRVRVDWQLGPLVQKTFRRTLAIVAAELQRAGTADVDVPPLLEHGWPADLRGTWHHMGTTRMHDSPREGVVDRDCRVHGVENLYVAGSSVFPTAGGNFPTMTLTALALRLADHLTQRVGRRGPGPG